MNTFFDDPRKILLLKFLRETKKEEVLVRANDTMIFIIKKLMEKYNLKTRQQVFELAVLSLALKVPPEKIAPIVRMRRRADSRKGLLDAYEYLVDVEF